MTSVKNNGWRQKKPLPLLKCCMCICGLMATQLIDREQWLPSQMDWPWASLLEVLYCVMFLKKCMHQWYKNCATPFCQYMCTTNTYCVMHCLVPPYTLCMYTTEVHYVHMCVYCVTFVIGCTGLLSVTSFMRRVVCIVYCVRVCLKHFVEKVPHLTTEDSTYDIRRSIWLTNLTVQTANYL